MVEKEKIERFYPNVEDGLSEEEVNLRYSQNLTNKSKRKTRQPAIILILRNVFSLLNVVLFTIAIFLITFNRITDCVFLIIALANTTIGLVQDLRAKKAVDNLSLVTKTKITVIRNKEKIEIPSDEIVLDDVIILKTNDLIPCDVKILKGKAVVNESILTGESLTTKKIEGQTLLSGSFITSGEAYCQVEKIGDECYISTLESKTKEFKKPKAKLKNEMSLILKVLCVVALIFGILQTIMVLVKNSDIIGNKELVSDLIIGPLGGSLISLIPSGMYFLFSATLLSGVYLLSKKKVLVHDMYSLDTLARVDTLCIDKTGTITDGTMCVEKLEFLNNNIDHNKVYEMFKTFVHNIGDDNYTNKALARYFKEEGNLKVKDKIRFDSKNKFSAMSFENEKTLIFGAYGFIKINNDDEFLKSRIDFYAKKGNRVLLVALNDEGIIEDEIKSESYAISLIVLKDNIKEDAKEIIKRFNENEVEIKVISGDNELTVENVARDVGIKNAHAISLIGLEEENLKNEVENYNIFGRTSPEQKKIIVESLIEKGHTVAMFGDGVNDILAFKAANVSISVANGANAAKDLASLIMVDNNFSGLPNVVYQGRRTINNLQRTCSLFLIKTVFSASLNFFFLLFGLFTDIGWPFTPGCFYVWEIASIGISAFLLALEPNKDRIQGKFITNIVSKALPQGLTLSTLVAILYLSLYFTNYKNIQIGDIVAFDSARVISTWFISITSFFIVLLTILPFNKYRLFVLLIDGILTFIISIWSIYSTNWLNLYGEPPRIMESMDLLISMVMILIGIIVLSLIYLSNNLIFKKRNKI